MKKTIVLLSLGLLCALSCKEPVGNEQFINDTVVGTFGDWPAGITLDELLNTPGIFKFYGPENRVYVMKDGAMSNSVDDYDNAQDVEVIYEGNDPEIIALADGREYILDAEEWHEITDPCGPNYQITTREVYEVPCNVSGEYRCCEEIVTWSCPLLTRINSYLVCDAVCRPVDPYHPHYPCGFYP